MKLDQRTLQVLKNFSSINPSILFREGNNLTTVTPTKTIFAKANLEQEFPSQFAIYDLNQVSISSKSLRRSRPGDRREVGCSTSWSKKVNYVFADQNTIVAPKSTSVNFPDSDVSFELTSEVLSTSPRHSVFSVSLKSQSLVMELLSSFRRLTQRTRPQTSIL
jgi:hypothetical protein